MNVVCLNGKGIVRQVSNDGNQTHGKQQALQNFLFHLYFPQLRKSSPKMSPSHNIFPTWAFSMEKKRAVSNGVTELKRNGTFKKKTTSLRVCFYFENYVFIVYDSGVEELYYGKGRLINSNSNVI